ncbi:MAG: hypothetical protein HUJ51_00645, partial [Eggerthellaceae bacterium]|nr:hypothetical protein [Eggerthellaceae bacterium]
MKKAANTSITYIIGAFVELLSVVLFLVAWANMAYGSGQNTLQTFVQGAITVHPLITFKYSLGGIIVAQFFIFAGAATMLKNHIMFELVLVLSLALLAIGFLSFIPDSFFKIFIR